MSDYYIRTPEQDESRGPFDISKLLTLAEAGQVTPNTLYYDEDKEEWLPLALNETLKAQVFPEREKLVLKVKEPEIKESEAPEKVKIEEILAAAEGDTKEKRKLTRQKKSLESAAKLSATGLGVMMLFSALAMILPLMPVIEKAAATGGGFGLLLNYPITYFGIFDFVVGILLILCVTEVFPLARGRAMLTLGFGLYVGWAIGDPILMGLSASASIGIFSASTSKSLTSMVIALILGIGGNACLAYLALNGRFDGFFEAVTLNLIAQ
jgi:hypothetical protein